MSQRIILSHEPAPGGHWVTIEVTNAYTDGTSRYDRVFVSRDELRGKTADERRQAILDALNDDPLEGISGETVAAPTQTKAILEARMVALYADWQRWKTTRVEAQDRENAAAVVTALTNRENAAWTRYVAAIQEWRSAP